MTDRRKVLKGAAAAVDASTGLGGAIRRAMAIPAVQSTTAQPWAGPVRALAVHGPDGFYRRFAAPAAAMIEVALRPDSTRGGAALKLINRGPRRQHALVSLAPAYGGDKLPPRTIRLDPGERVTNHWPLAASHQWYDLTVALVGVEGFEQRFAGRFHNGRPGLTDPGIGGMRV